MKTDHEKTRRAVREGYAKVAAGSGSCCGSGSATKIGKTLGYSDAEIGSVPEGANLGLGCGNPVAIAGLREGETVLDLGSGAGFDAFLAAGRVGPKGRVIGVDMTPEMIEKARANAARGKYANVEFRLGEIEHLPVADASVDVVISNCVINLSTDKAQVFREAFRVLKPGGRLMISDIVATRELPERVKKSVEAHVGCLAGAPMKTALLDHAKATGFDGVRVADEKAYPVADLLNDPTGKELLRELALDAKEIREVENSVASVRVEARKPAPAKCCGR